MFSVSMAAGLDADILSLAILPDARNPRARAVAIFPAPINPTEETFVAMIQTAVRPARKDKRNSHKAQRAAPVHMHVRAWVIQMREGK